VLSTLHELGADSTIRLDKADEELIAAFRREASEKRFEVIIDYLWGRPTEALLKAITGKEFAIRESETRLMEVGESAGSSNHSARGSPAKHGAEDSRNRRSAV